MSFILRDSLNNGATVQQNWALPGIMLWFYVFHNAGNLECSLSLAVSIEHKGTKLWEKDGELGHNDVKLACAY